jgi:hypothetical protein
MRHGMITGFVFLALLVFAGAALAQGNSENWPHNTMSSNGASTDCRDLSILVRETGGLPISDATITIENAWDTKTDMNGIAVVRCQAGLHYPTTIEVSAPGYKSIRTAVNPMGGIQVPIDLDRQAGGRAFAGSGTTVSARELSPDVRDKSYDLQLKASQALQHQDYNSAKELLKKALELTPSSPAICNNLGVAFLRSNDLDTASIWFEKAAKAAPHDSQLVGNLGIIRWMQHRGDDSYDILSRAEAMGYESIAGNYILGVTLLQRGYTKRSIQHLKKVPAPKFPYRDLYLSIALRQTGKDKAAQEAYDSFLRHVPVFFSYVEFKPVSESALLSAGGERH